MGGMNSCCIPSNRNPNRCKENHTSTPRIKGHKRNLSAAFNMADLEATYTEISPEQVNINFATEEELMTLPGINRSTAHNIVDYRRQIGGFKKIEDLALVSGVGATKLNQIRMEICVGKRKGSQNSSTTSSRNDLSIQDTSSKSSVKGHTRSNSSYSPRINVNSCNVFHLLKIKGMSQTIAENIVAYREKRGQFKHLDDLVKVKGVSLGVLSAVRPYLVLTNDPQPDIIAHGLVTYPSHSRQNSQHSQLELLRNSQTDSMLNGQLFDRVSSRIQDSDDDLISLYGPIARKSFRKKVSPVTFSIDSRPVFRIATWNLEKCSKSKTDNPGVREVTCMTVLENGLSILVVQELDDKEALQKICDELNNPTIPNVRRWGGHKGTWRCETTGHSDTISNQPRDHMGFLYDTSRGVDLVNSALLNPSSQIQRNIIHRQPATAVFKVGGSELVLVSVHLELPNNDAVSGQQGDSVSHVEGVMQALQPYIKAYRDVILLGDFNTAVEPPALTSRGYQKVCEVSSKSSSVTAIWANQLAQQKLTGKHGTITEGLSSPWIPDGWSWGGKVSHHFPLWMEFYFTEVMSSSSRQLITVDMA